MTQMIQVSLFQHSPTILFLNETLFSIDTLPKELNDSKRDSYCISRLNYYNTENYFVRLFIVYPYRY